MGSRFIPCPKSYNQTRLELEFQIKQNPYIKRTLINKENIKLSSTTDRYTVKSATPTLFLQSHRQTAFHTHRQSSSLAIGMNASPLLDLVIFGCFPIGTNLHRQLPCRLITIAPSADLHFINSRCVSKDTCPKTVSTYAPKFWSIKSLMLRNSPQ